jgi:hypothetical protein
VSSIKQLRAELRKVQTPQRRKAIKVMARDIVHRAIKRQGIKLSSIEAGSIDDAVAVLIDWHRPVRRNAAAT